MSHRRLFISFSGGETSAFMTQWILANWQDRYDEFAVVFANTGQESEETLEFVKQCDEHFGWGVVWVEAVVHHGEKRAPTHKLVDFETADRAGGPFEEHIKKYGIPNSKFKDCTRSLKLRPLESYLRSIGWGSGSFDTAIGIRADEIDRTSVHAKARRLVYPLISECPMRKPMINTYWANMPFRLKLKGFQGNCKWCWKKSLRKHLTLIQIAPEVFDFPRRMEAQYSQVGPEFRADVVERRGALPPDYRRTFFRGNRSVADLFAEYESKKDSFVPAPDDADVYVKFDPDLDVGGGCEESCEVYSDEDAEKVAEE